MGFLIDTNVLSELRKGARADANVREWFRQATTEELYLSVLSVGELVRGIERLRPRDPRAAAALETWRLALLSEFSDRILPVDLELAERWGALDAPTPLPVVDGLLAATARAFGLTVVTRNSVDFRRTGAAFVDPWTSPVTSP